MMKKLNAHNRTEVVFLTRFQNENGKRDFRWLGREWSAPEGTIWPNICSLLSLPACRSTMASEVTRDGKLAMSCYYVALPGCAGSGHDSCALDETAPRPPLGLSEVPEPPASRVWFLGKLENLLLFTPVRESSGNAGLMQMRQEYVAV
jgi:hypothetical protein